MKFFLALIVSLYGVFLTQPLQAQALEAPPMAPAWVESSDSWQLPESNFVGAKMPMTVVHPRSFSASDGGDETASWARHKKAYPGIEYRIPISIQGGAYPFYYEILEAPEWLSIAGKVWEEGYGELHGIAPSQTGGPYTVRVKITDQELTEKIVEFPLTVTDSTNDFIFVDANAPTSGNGTIGSPFNSLGNDVFAGGDRLATTYPGRAVYLRGGTHDLLPENPASRRMRITVERFPFVFLGYPGEVVTVNFANGRIITEGSTATDLFFGGFTLEESTLHDQSNFVHVWSMTRLTWFDLDLRKINVTPSGSNEGSIHTSGAGSLRPYWTFWGLRIDESEGNALGSFYSCQRMVFEDIQLGVGRSVGTGTGIMLKGVNSWVSLRRVDGGFEGGWERVIRNYNRQSSGPQEPRFVEIAYSRIGRPEGQSSTGLSITMLTADGRDADTDPPSHIWAYRNTVIGGAIGLEYDPHGHFSYENNVNFADLSTHFDGGNNAYSLTIEGNLTGRYADRSVYLDQNYRLKTPHRESWLGKVGHEIHH